MQPLPSVEALVSELAARNIALPQGPDIGKCTPYPVAGPGGLPLALRLSEGLGSTLGAPEPTRFQERHRAGAVKQANALMAAAATGTCRLSG